MPTIICPDCRKTTIYVERNYSGMMQCSSCARILNVRITNGIVADVSLAVPGRPEVKGLPSDLKEIYDEAGRCIAAKCYTAVELICRKILMHVAVEKGAEEGASFAEYLKYLEANGYIASQMLSWVDLIRRHGNQATHKIATPDGERAESTLMFTSELLRLVYEMEFLAKKYSGK